jgi:hypothetical protein
VSIQDELNALKDGNGIIDAKVVLKWARTHRKSAIAKKLTWNNVKAANEFRLVQIRRLIIVYTTNVHSEPTVISLTTDRVEGGGYRQIGDVLSDASLRDIAVRDAVTFLYSAYAKYSYLVELANVGRELELVRKRFVGKGIAA